uniref:Uncharacterized protein n=1 Tax=Myotis myotis TaxID=51298 RepID=A0A7J7SRQ1_MYOMY|nr:hypothetical protein mMyoMyo1_009317 [Myotis myotis]
MGPWGASDVNSSWELWACRPPARDSLWNQHQGPPNLGKESKPGPPKKERRKGKLGWMENYNLQLLLVMTCRSQNLPTSLQVQSPLTGNSEHVLSLYSAPHALLSDFYRKCMLRHHSSPLR